MSDVYVYASYNGGIIPMMDKAAKAICLERGGKWIGSSVLMADPREPRDIQFRMSASSASDALRALKRAGFEAWETKIPSRS